MFSSTTTFPSVSDGILCLASRCRCSLKRRLSANFVASLDSLRASLGRLCRIRGLTLTSDPCRCTSRLQHSITTSSGLRFRGQGKPYRGFVDSGTAYPWSPGGSRSGRDRTSSVRWVRSPPKPCASRHVLELRMY